MRLTDRSLVFAMCLGQVGNLLPHVAVPAVMPQHLMPLWSLSGSQAGMMASAFAFGYMLAVPVLTTLTDRIDARGILLVGSAVTALATLAFGWLAHGLWSAAAIWGLAGIGFAGAYMPGLKALTDRLPPGDVSRSVTLYTSSFSFGVGLSFLVCQLVAERFGWRLAFLVTGLGPLIMVVTCLLMPAVKPKPSARKLLDFGPVLKNRPAMGYVLGYGAHCFELYGIRTWLVAFWAFVAARHPDALPFGPIAVSVAFAILAMPASILGNEAALRFGRHRALNVLMVASAAVAVAIGLSVQASPLLLLRVVAALWPDRPVRFRRADLGHGDERGNFAPRRHHGDALDRWLWIVGGGGLGRGRRTRCGWRSGEHVRVVRRIHVARRCDPAWPGCTVVVAAGCSRVKNDGGKHKGWCLEEVERRLALILNYDPRRAPSIAAA